MNTKTYITPRSKLFETIEADRWKKEELRVKEEGPVGKSFYTTYIVGLLSFYIPKSQSLTSRSDLELLIRY